MAGGAGLSGIGHNGGPTLEPGFGFRKVAWTKARAALLPSLPLEVVRLRVARAQRLGLSYRRYASIRAATGCDIVAFLFSDNALDLRRARIEVPAGVAARLAGLQGAATRLAAVHPPHAPGAVLAANAGLDAAAMAPGLSASWRETRDRLRALVRAQGVPFDGVVVVPATMLEGGWCAAAGLAGAVPAEAFFAPTA